MLQAATDLDTLYDYDTSSTKEIASFFYQLSELTIEEIAGKIEDDEIVVTNSLWQEWMRDKIETKEQYDPNPRQIRSWISLIKFPEKWRIDGIAAPNFYCKELTEKIAIKLYEDYLLLPQRITPTIEEGVFLYYRNFDKGKELSIEIYNDLEIAAVINKSDEIVKVMDVDVESEDILEMIKLFNE